jgi:hypothetical protein
VKDPTHNKALGIVVFRLDGQRALLLDIIAHPKHFPNLIDQARWYCGQLRGHELVAWITSAYLDTLGSGWGRLDNPNVQIPTSICTDGPSSACLKDRWFLTAGDTEFK